MPCPFHDPFKKPRQEDGVLVNEIQGETIPMVLRHADVRRAARDWQTYSSDAPMRVPIPSEEEVRSVRQLPIETDPPAHGAYRALVEPFFNRAIRRRLIVRRDQTPLVRLHIMHDKAFVGDPGNEATIRRP